MWINQYIYIYTGIPKFKREWASVKYCIWISIRLCDAPETLQFQINMICSKFKSLQDKHEQSATKLFIFESEVLTITSYLPINIDLHNHNIQLIRKRKRNPFTLIHLQKKRATKEKGTRIQMHYDKQFSSSSQNHPAPNNFVKKMLTNKNNNNLRETAQRQQKMTNTS